MKKLQFTDEQWRQAHERIQSNIANGMPLLNAIRGEGIKHPSTYYAYRKRMGIETSLRSYKPNRAVESAKPGKTGNFVKFVPETSQLSASNKIHVGIPYCNAVVTLDSNDKDGLAIVLDVASRYGAKQSLTN